MVVPLTGRREVGKVMCKPRKHTLAPRDTHAYRVAHTHTHSVLSLHRNTPPFSLLPYLSKKVEREPLETRLGPTLSKCLRLAGLMSDQHLGSPYSVTQKPHM